MKGLVSACGLTLVELLVALSVSTVFLGLAIPAYQELVVNRRLGNQVQMLSNSLMLARSEAVKRSRPITLCKSAADLVCDNTIPDWSSGWLLFEDLNSDGEVDDEDTPLRLFGDGGHSITVSWNNGNTMGFNRQGESRKAGTFTLCAEASGGAKGRTVTLSATGRTRVTEVTDCG